VKNRLALLFFILTVSFAVNVDVVKDMIDKQLSPSFAKYKKYEMVIMQEPQNASKIITGSVVIDPIKAKPGMNVFSIKGTIGDKMRVAKYLVKINVFDDVFVAKQRVKSNDRFVASNFEKKLMDVSSIVSSGKQWVTSTADFAEYRFVRPIRRGDIILERMLEPMPDVLKDDVLKLTLNEGVVRMTCEVVAMEEAFVGDIIDVIHPKYKKPLQVVVKESANVEMKG